MPGGETGGVAFLAAYGGHSGSSLQDPLPTLRPPRVVYRGDQARQAEDNNR